MSKYGETARGWKTFFWVAAAFNFAIGLAGMLVPEATIDGRTIGLLVFAFGIVYMQVARDPRRFGPVLWAGILGKVGVVALLGPGEFGPTGSTLISAVLAGDALFAFGFLVFLFTHGDLPDGLDGTSATQGEGE
jgi:hypothetical protein